MNSFNIEKQGESITFFGDADSSAPKAELEVQLAPGAFGPPPHMHTKQHEHFEVISGRMIGTVNGEEHILEVGDKLTIEPGQAHTFRNGSETERLVFRAFLEPALHFQWFLSEAAKIAIRKGGSWDDLSLLEVAYIMNQVRDEYRLAAIHPRLQDILFPILARIAVLMGRTKDIAPINARVEVAVVPEPPVK